MFNISFKVGIIKSILREAFEMRFCDDLNIGDNIVIEKIANLKVSKNIIGINDINFVYIGELDESSFINKFLDGDMPYDMIIIDSDFVKMLKNSKLFERGFVYKYDLESFNDDSMNIESFKVSREFDSYYDDASREIIKMIG